MKNSLFSLLSLFTIISSSTLDFVYVSAQEILKSPIGARKIQSQDHEFVNTEIANLNWIEDISARTAFSATYKAAGGFIKVEHNQHAIHRKVNGVWERIDPTLVPINENLWHAPNQDFPTFLNANGCFYLTTQSEETWQYGVESKVQEQIVHYHITHHENNAFYFALENQPIIKELLFLQNGVKYNYRLTEQINLTTPQLMFSEKINLPKGMKIIELKSFQETFWGQREVITLFIQDEKNNIQGVIYTAYAIDADGQSEPATYQLIYLGDESYELQISLSNAWLNQSERSYPVLVDPLIVGPTSDWLGGQMPSCITPIQNKDSILVTIPANITPISLAVRSSFYADPWTNATMSMGAMQFSTSCNSTQLYQIQGADGALPGTAYLDSANMLNPLLCCFTQSCNSQQFYLRKHLSRTGPGTGCNTTYIRYDPFTTQWPFRAIVYGRTLEVYAAEWTVPLTPRCADECEFNATAYVRYGVPPYTFTHPWQDTFVVQGNVAGCNTGQTNHQFQLTIPNCPIYCDENYTSLPVPNPTVIDACGNVLTTFPIKSLNIKPSPQIVAFSDTILCAGETIEIDLSNCLTTGDVNWSADGNSGVNNITLTTDPNIGGTFVYNFLVTASLNGCEAEPYFQPVHVFPLPNVSFVVSSENTYLGDLVEFQNTSTGVSLAGNQWLWSYGDSDSQISIHGQHTYSNVGEFQVCLSLLGGESCANAFCQFIPVVPNEIDVPNVFSPNGDGSNDVLNLFFDWAEVVEMTILNRWGNVIAEIQINDYQSGWNGKLHNSGVNMPNGVYFYEYKITTTVGSQLKGQSFVHLIRD